jgi:copper homeostasis protein
MRVAVEVCVASVEEAQAAAELGADSVEVCSWLSCGGITPGSGLVDTIRGVADLTVRVLVRPSPGGFRYSTLEHAILLTDAEVFGGGGLGLVTGSLDEHGLPHFNLLRELRRAAPESELTFHRAIDVSSDPLKALDRCLESGLDRILTSGAATLAMDGIPLLKEMVTRSQGRCELAIAGGIGPANVVELVERTGAREVHFAAQRPAPALADTVSMSSTHSTKQFLTVPDRSKIEGVLNALTKAGLR